MMMATVRKLPLLVILGATGTGKSKLSLELAQRFNGEIISADSMQVYRGLDVITNKVTVEEQRRCRHHLIGYIDPFTPTNTVVDFRNHALPIIERLFEEDRMPVIVGGTNYYIEALLWNFLINTKDIERAKKEEHQTNRDVQQIPLTEVAPVSCPAPTAAAAAAATTAVFGECGDDTDECLGQSMPVCPDSAPPGSGSHSPTNSKMREGRFATFDTADLYRRLMQVDLDKGRSIHPHNRRRIIRALEVYEDHRVAISDIHRAQHLGSGGPALSGPLRYPNTCIVWIQCEHKVLCERLDSRVDSMLDRGLLQELDSFHSLYKQHTACSSLNPDYTLGIFQSIGFKEFHNYLMLTEEEKQTDKGRQLREEGIAELKRVTRRYAKRQIQWIQNRFLKRPGDNVPVVYSVDSTHPSRWQDDVLSRAEDVLAAVIEGRQPSVAPVECSHEASDEPLYNVCQVCGGRVFVTRKQWESHVKSRKHKKLFGKKLKREREEQQGSVCEQR